MIKGIIFDFDNVLIDSKKATFSYYKKIFKHFKVKFPKGIKKKPLYTLTGKDNYKKFFAHISKKEFYDYRKTIDYKKYIKKIKLTKGAKSILKYLNKKKYKTAIATNRGSTTQLLTDQLKITKYFNIILTSKNLKKTKPDPYPINLAIKKLKLKKPEIIYVGDAMVDIKAGKSAKVNVALFKNKFKGADYYIENFKQIKKIIKMENNG
jgi:phosphoglycolate phosphatase